MKEVEKADIISDVDDAWARKLTSYLGKNPDVSRSVEEVLFSSRTLAVANRKKNESLVEDVTDKDVLTVSQWLKTNYENISKNFIALAIVFVAVPFGMNAVSFENNTLPTEFVSAPISDEDLYLENTYHIQADSFDEEYLKEMGFI